MISAIKKKVEPKEEAKPTEEKTSRVNSIVLIPGKTNGGKRVDVCGHQYCGKSNKKIKIATSEKAPTLGVLRDVELQIGKWKSNEDFEDSSNSATMGRSNPYCHRAVNKDGCTDASGYEGWDQCVIVNPTSQRCFVWEKH
ncbi:hypothetical protein GOBAR_AA36072 [Gossypium barbadense]|uniref:Uncharacterized protein n=1 Tax=Gossypium barbadense TaxID=3634 RepID=A0A2P5W0Q3_GOSBA|nr:hypothetical protein GOBAR_AA36072 [Gossypium barbadense]